MKISEVNESLIGKKVSCVFTGLRTTGIIIGIVENEYTKGVEIKFDNPIQWGDDFYTHYESTSRKSDGFGNLKHTEIIK